MIDKVESIVAHVSTTVTDLKYTATDFLTEPTKYPAFIVDEFSGDFEKKTMNAQVYNAVLNLKCFVFAIASMTASNFKTLVDNVIKALVTYPGVKYIKIKQAYHQVGQISEDQLKMYFLNVEYWYRQDYE